MAKVKIQIHEDGLRDLLEQGEVRSVMEGVARNVKAQAESTAQDAQGGPGGQLHGYAEAGFTLTYEAGSGRRRPRFLITSLADPAMAVRVHIYTTIRDGLGHLRKALRDGAKN